MSIYYNVVQELKIGQYSKELYRFQGANSFEYFDVKNNCFNADNRDCYVYFSTSINHHKYFTTRRLRQFINKVVLNDTEYSLCRKQLSDAQSYSNMCNLLINSSKIMGLNSIRLIYDRSYYDLLSSNCSVNKYKARKQIVERVDRRIYNGGYGITGEWLSLLEHMTIFSCTQRITRENILTLVQNMKVNKSVNAFINANFLLQNGSYQINPYIYNDFTKYDIMNDLEQIVDKGLCLESSELYKNPSGTIKKIVLDYQNTRQKTLQLLNDSYNRVISQ